MKKRLLVFVSTAILASSLMAFAQVYVHIGPPPPAPREIVPAPMHRGWVWQAGYYRWDGRRYVWMPGHVCGPAARLCPLDSRPLAQQPPRLCLGARPLELILPARSIRGLLSADGSISIALPSQHPAATAVDRAAFRIGKFLGRPRTLRQSLFPPLRKSGTQGQGTRTGRFLGRPRTSVRGIDFQSLPRL